MLRFRAFFRLALLKGTHRTHSPAPYLLSQRALGATHAYAMSTKRKAQELSDTDDCNSPPKASMSKKAKPSTVAPSPNGFAPNGQPNNKVLPANVVFSAKNENCLRIATWNICGLAASQKKASLIHSVSTPFSDPLS